MKKTSSPKRAISDYIGDMWNKLTAPVRFPYFLCYYYGERLRDYPPTVAMKLLFSRFIFLTQLHLLLHDKRFLVNYYGRAKLYMRLWWCAIYMDIVLGIYEYWKTRLFFSLIKQGMTIVDIGAWEGNYSILFAKLMQDKGKVLAFEPDPDNCEWLKKNIKVNNYKCVEVHQFALADREAMASFQPDSGMGYLVSQSAWVYPSQKEPFMVRTRRLDDVLDELNIKHIDVIKMDVQGSDILVLRGAERTLRNNCILLPIKAGPGLRE